MTLERFGFIGTERKCFWGMIGVEWLTPLKIEQVGPGFKPGSNQGASVCNLKSKLLSASEEKSLCDLFNKEHDFKLLYKASSNGWKKNDFVNRVIGKGHTFHIMKISNGRLVGGLIPMNLKSDKTKDYKLSHKTWMFYFKNGVAKKITHKNGYEVRQYTKSSGNLVAWYGGMDFT